MKRSLLIRLSLFVLGIILIFAFLILGNTQTKRLSVGADDIIALDSLDDDLYLLNPDWQMETTEGENIYTTQFSISTSEISAGIYFPRAKHATLYINNSSENILEENEHIIYFFEPMQEAQTISIEYHLPTESHEMYSSNQLYISNYNAILAADYREGNMRLFIIGLSFTIVLFSISLYIQKPSEKYLLPLALLAFSTLGYVLIKAFPSIQESFWLTILFLGHIKIPFLASDTSILLYSIGFPLLVGWFNYLILKNFISVQLFKIDYFYFIIPACIITLVATKIWAIPFMVMGLHIYINILESIVLIRGKYKHNSDTIVLLSGAIGTLAMNIFITGCATNLIPHGNVDLLFRLGGGAASIYPIAFTIAVNGIFARKYAESEILSEELNNLNQNLQQIVNERTSELETAYKSLEKEQKQKDIFTTNIAHSLKTPLFAITGFADMAQEALKSKPDQVETFLNQIITNVDYVVKLVNNLFLAIRLEYDQVNYIIENINLRKMMEQIYNATLAQTQKKEIRLNFEAPESPLQIESDRYYLTLAIQNIADNAVRHTLKGGEITLKIFDIDENIHISVTDDGEGMSDEVIQHIFERYYSNCNQGNGSSGLGLTISKDVISSLQGQIQVVSTPTKGTEFTIILPKESHPRQ